MNYIGSKLSLLQFLEESIGKVVDKESNVFCDLFAGTGAVGAHFKKRGYRVISNDIQYYSFVLNKHYIENHTPLRFTKLVEVLPRLKKVSIKERGAYVLEYLSRLKGRKGFIFENYCPGGKSRRQYFLDENGMVCDTVRMKIELWKKKKFISEGEYYFLLTSLLEAIDKYANTASVYGAYLKTLKKSAQRPLQLKPAELIINKGKHRVFNEDINTLVKRIKGDILYLDPPYNHRQYATNYHVLETIAKYDRPKLHGKTGLRSYEDQKSLYCSRSSVKKAFAEVIRQARVRYIFLSYNNEGLLSLKDIKEIMSLRGEYGFFKKEHSRYKADNNRKYKAKKTVEYLHYVKVQN